VADAAIRSIDGEARVEHGLGSKAIGPGCVGRDLGLDLAYHNVRDVCGDRACVREPGLIPSPVVHAARARDKSVIFHAVQDARQSRPMEAHSSADLPWGATRIPENADQDEGLG
jgi:hypothetical protein